MFYLFENEHVGGKYMVYADKLHRTNSFKKNELDISACTVMTTLHTDACM